MPRRWLGDLPGTDWTAQPQKKWAARPSWALIHFSPTTGASPVQPTSYPAAPSRRCGCLEAVRPSWGALGQGPGQLGGRRGLPLGVGLGWRDWVQVRQAPQGRGSGCCVWCCLWAWTCWGPRARSGGQLQGSQSRRCGQPLTKARPRAAQGSEPTPPELQVFGHPAAAIRVRWHGDLGGRGEQVIAPGPRRPWKTRKEVVRQGSLRELLGGGPLQAELQSTLWPPPALRPPPAGRAAECTAAPPPPFAP